MSPRQLCPQCRRYPLALGAELCGACAPTSRPWAPGSGRPEFFTHPGMRIAQAAIARQLDQLDMLGAATMAEASLVAGQHYDTFRKSVGGWRDLVRDEGFPAPYRLKPYLWRRGALIAWQERRELEATQRLRAGDARPANDPSPEDPRPPPRPG